MNINDFKDIYSDIHATPELKKRVLEKAAEQDNKREPRFFKVVGPIMATAAAFALIIGGAFFIRFLNAQAQPTIVVTAGEKPELTDAPLSTTTSQATTESVKSAVKSEQSYFITEAPELTEAIKSNYSFMNIYDEAFVKTDSEKYENLYEWVVGEDISEEKARELLDDKGLSKMEIDAIVTRDEAFCEKIFTMNAYSVEFYGTETYLSAADLYNYDVHDYYTLLLGGITFDDMANVMQRIYKIEGESECYYAMKRKALLYKSLVLSYETGIDINESWANEYFAERVTKLYSPFDELFSESEVEELKSIASEPTVHTVFNYYMLIKRTGVSEDLAREKLEQCKNEANARIFKDSEIDLILGNDSYLFAKHFLSPYAVMSYQSLAGGSLIVTAEDIIKAGAYWWLIDYSDINPYSVSNVIADKLAEGGYSEILEYWEEQLDIYEKICEITENKLNAAVLSADMKLLEDTKSEPNDSERERLRQLSFTIGEVELTGETIYECELNYLLSMSNLMLNRDYVQFDDISVTEAIDKACEYLSGEEKNWLTVKKNLYLYHLREDGFSLYNDEYIGALLDSSAYSWRLDGEMLYVEPYYESVVEYLKQYHITNVKSDEYTGQMLYRADLAEYIVTVEAQVGTVTGEGYYNAIDNMRVCLYSYDGTLISTACSSNGMAGLDGYLVYVIPEERYLDVYRAPSGEVLLVLHTFYPERYREEGEVFTIDEETKELKRFGSSGLFSESYGYGMFDYGTDGLTLCSDSEPIYRNERDGQLIYFDFGAMLMRPADDVSYNEVTDE